MPAFRPASPNAWPSAAESHPAEVSPRMKSPRSLLLIKPGSMGDVIHALPVVSALHAAWPETEITWVIDPRWQPLLEGHPAIARLLPFPRETFRGLSGSLSAAAWYGRLGNLRPEIAIDLQGLLRSALIARFSRAKRIYGLDDAREGSRFFYARTARTGLSEHAVDRYLHILPEAGLEIPREKDFRLWNLSDRARQLLPDSYIVLHPFARGAGKSLTGPAITALVRSLLDAGIPSIALVGFGTPPPGLPDEVIDLTRKTTLAELTGILRDARFAISVDSGPMHLAAALGTPLLGIHTWSDPRKVGPYSQSAWIWQGGQIRRQDLSMAPLIEAPFTIEEAVKAGRFVADQLQK